VIGLDVFLIDAQLRANDMSDEERQSIETRLMEACKLLGALDALKRFKYWKSPNERELDFTRLSIPLS
jgi:hypothetical protein